MLPSDMVHDGPVNIGHLIALENTVDGLRSQNKATLAVLQDILSRLSPAPALNMQAPLHYTLPASAGCKKIPLKPSPPLDFDGECSAGKAFLTSCQTYIRLWSEVFDDDLVKVIWAMSYMNAGHAGHWAVREFETEACKGRLHFLDWLNFEKEFKKDFLPLNTEAAAVNALKMTDYFQGDQTVDAYLDQFRDLICDTKYSDPKTIVVKFRWGLNHRISMVLAGMPIGRPSDRDPEAWFHLAVQMDQNQATDDAFHSQVLTTAFAAVPPCEPSTLLMGTDTCYDARQMDVNELLKVLESKPVGGGHPTDEEFRMPRRVACAKPAPVSRIDIVSIKDRVKQSVLYSQNV